MFPKLSNIMYWLWRTILFDLCFGMCFCNSWFTSVHRSKPLHGTLPAADVGLGKEESFLLEWNLYVARKWNLKWVFVTRIPFKVFWRDNEGNYLCWVAENIMLELDGEGYYQSPSKRKDNLWSKNKKVYKEIHLWSNIFIKRLVTGTQVPGQKWWHLKMERLLNDR